MIKILAFLEADLPRVEDEVNKYMNKYSIEYIFNTGSRLVFVLKEKSQRDPISHRRVTQKES
jgi:hypothetical protein